MTAMRLAEHRIMESRSIMSEGRKKDVAEYFFAPAPRGPLERAELLAEIRRRCGAPGVVIFECLERIGDEERRRMAGLVQTATRRAAREQLRPVLPRRTSAPAAPSEAARPPSAKSRPRS
jgi:hypothetical protein